MVTNKEIQLIAKELNLYNISNGTIDLEDEKVSDLINEDNLRKGFGTNEYEFDIEENTIGIKNKSGMLKAFRFFMLCLI